MLKIGILGKFNEISALLEKVCIKIGIPLTMFQINENLLQCKGCKVLLNIHPNILVFNTLPKNLDYFDIPDNCIILLNIDKLNKSINFNKNYIITYGFNKNSTITISSTNNEDNLLFCIQSDIKSLLGKTIYPQEFPVNYYKKNVYSVLVATTIGILIDFKPENFKKVF